MTAEKMFRAIADDHSSPWSGVAPYLVARSLARQATLGVKGVGADRDKLAAAEAQLQIILNDPAQSPVHPAAQKVLDYVRVRLAPGARMHDLAAALVRKDSQATIERNSYDYRYLYDSFQRGNFGGTEALPTEDDLTAWISAFQAGDGTAAVKRWRETQTLPWLVAALSMTSGDHAGASELIAGGEKVLRGSPGYATTTFHTVRLLIESKQTGEAQKLLTQPHCPSLR